MPGFEYITKTFEIDTLEDVHILKIEKNNKTAKKSEFRSQYELSFYKIVKIR